MMGSKQELGQTFEEILGWPGAVGDLLRLTFHGIATYIGIWVGLNAGKIKTGNRTAKHVTIGLGYALAAGQGLGAIADIISLGKRIAGTHPPSKPSPSIPEIAPIPPVR